MPATIHSHARTIESLTGTATTHKVSVEIDDDELVAASPNPVVIQGGDTVVWQVSLPTHLADREVAIDFPQFVPDEQNCTVGNHPRFGPFEALSLAGSEFTATGDNGRRGSFVYKVLLVEPTGEKKLRWRNGDNGGGLDVGGPPG